MEGVYQDASSINSHDSITGPPFPIHTYNHLIKLTMKTILSTLLDDNGLCAVDKSQATNPKRINTLAAALSGDVYRISEAIIQ